MAFDDDIIWDEPENNKKKKAIPRRLPKRTTPKPQPEQEIVQEQVQSSDLSVNSQAVSQTPSYQVADDVYYSQMYRRNFRRRRGVFGNIWENFRNFIVFQYIIEFVSGIIVFIVFVAFGGWAAIRDIYTPMRPARNRSTTVVQDSKKVEQPQNTPDNSLIRNANRALYAKNFSTVSQAILLLQADGRYCSFTALGMANCFNTVLNVSNQSGNVLYLEDGTIYTFDCENQKCTLDVDMNVNNAEVMSIPLSADEDGNVLINKKDVAKFLDE